MSEMPSASQKRKRPTRWVCARYDIVPRTVDRWVQAGILPEPEKINGRNYFDEDAVEARDQARLHRGDAA
jgi:hypothetical protein